MTPAKNTPTKAAIRKPVKLYARPKSKRADEIASWLQLWGLSAELHTAGREAYFDVSVPDHWGAHRRARFAIGLKSFGG